MDTDEDIEVDKLKADIKELGFAAGIADTFHGRNCCAALDRVEEALTHAIEHMKRGEPEGWQLVPKEPVGEMLSAGVKANNIYGTTLAQNMRGIYKAMLSASPQPQEGE